MTTGIVIYSMEWQIFPLPNLNVVALCSCLTLFNQVLLQTVFVHPESKTAILSVSPISVFVHSPIG